MSKYRKWQFSCSICTNTYGNVRCNSVSIALFQYHSEREQLLCWLLPTIQYWKKYPTVKYWKKSPTITRKKQQVEKEQNIKLQSACSFTTHFLSTEQTPLQAFAVGFSRSLDTTEPQHLHLHWSNTASMTRADTSTSYVGMKMQV